jgi:hypothetical protein
MVLYSIAWILFYGSAWIVFHGYMQVTVYLSMGFWKFTKKAKEDNVELDELKVSITRF